jgi:hypothetical protein
VGQQGDEMKPMQKKLVLKLLDDCVDHLLVVIQRDERGEDAHELADVICQIRNVIKEILNETTKK